MKMKLIVSLFVVLCLTLANAQVKVGLITKTETNPFFVKMKEGAQAAADELGMELLTAAGTQDGDNESQVTAIENMIVAGVAGILLTANDSAAIVPSVEKAREAGIVVIALDSPLVPEDASDALYATDNYKAGLFIGEWAKASMGDTAPVIATLDLFPGHPVGAQRHNGFLEGMGLVDADASDLELFGDQTDAVVCMQDSFGDQSKGQTGMENCLTANPDINLVYTINEPAAFGAYTAIKNAGLEDQVTIVSVDGGCAGIRGVVDGVIDATSQQYPLLMASLGVQTVYDVANGAAAPSGYTDTGVTLITDAPVSSMVSGGSEFGLANCWGE